MGGTAEPLSNVQCHAAQEALTVRVGHKRTMFDLR
jgi:hypothetical protein